MSDIRTIKLLPQVFQTDTNKKFLGATIDQLVSTPDLVNINGYIGRQLAPTRKADNSYIPEPTLLRQNYQLEPSVVVRNKSGKTEFFGNYIDLLQQIQYLGGSISNHDRLFANESYSYSGLFDYDKFVNFNQYYWLPDGPSQDLPGQPVINVSSSGLPVTEIFTVTRDPVTNSYLFTGYGNITSPTVNLARGGTYQFIVNQPGVPFYIQSQPGLEGLNFDQPGTSNRDIFGVTNNGIDVGTITFRVPQTTAQNYFSYLTSEVKVDIATTIPFKNLYNKTVQDIVTQYGGIEGITTELSGKRIIFLNNINDEELWEAPGIYELYGYDALRFEEGFTVPYSFRNNIATIHIINEDGVIQFVEPQPVDPTQKVFVKTGINNANRSYYLNRDNNWELVPNITADLNFLYYQDGTLNQINGQFKIVDPINSFIDIEKEILGKKNYRSPNGVVLTNGLRIAFDVDVIPTYYQEREFYVEGVGSSIRLVPVDELTPEWPLDPNTGTYDPATPDYITINRGSLDRNVWSRSNRWFHIDVINSTAEYLGEIPIVKQSTRALRPIIEFEPDIQLFNTGKKFKSIVDILELSAVTKALQDVQNHPADSSTTATVTVGTTILNLQHGQKIIFGVDEDNLVANKIYTVEIVDLIDDPLVNDYRVNLVETTGGTCKDGHVVFAKQVFTPTENQDYVDYWFDGAQWNYSQQKTTYNQSPLFDVFDADNYSIADTTKYLKSTFNGTKIFSYKQGLGTKDPYLGFPLSYRNFNNVGDIQFNNNFDNDTFTYKTSEQVLSIVEKNIDNFYLKQNNKNVIIDEWIPNKNYLINDIVIYNGNYYQALEDINESEVFYIQVENSVPIWKLLTDSEVNAIEKFAFRNVWIKNKEFTKQYQLFSYVYTGDTNYFEIDVEPKQSTGVPTILVYRNNDVMNTNDYSITTVVGRLTVRIQVTLLTVGDVINIKIYGDQVSEFGYYEIPLNLDLNSINSKFDILTLGQIRNHLITMSHNSNFIQGVVPGISNLRDLEIKSQGGSILQHASPIIYSNLFLLDKNLNFTKALDLAQREYSNFKNKLLELSATNFNLVNLSNIPETVDNLMSQINQVKNNKFPWYYSDMVPSGGPKKTIPYIVLNPELRRYEITTIFDDTVVGNKAVLLWYQTTKKDTYGNLILDSNGEPTILDSVPLIKGRDYYFEQDRPSVYINSTVPLLYNDRLLIVEYNNTDGSFVPETPTKLGLYPKFEPSKFIDNTYITPILVIQGHDGSITPAFNDYRDDILLDFESRIYNNLKVTYNNTVLDIYNYIPGKFRNTNYSLDEFNSVLSQSFLKWIGNNRIDYASNIDYNSNNPFTWNYKKFIDVIDGGTLPGSWRAVFKYFYDTERPHTNPWEMLGFSEEPSWWANHYGSAPYTGGNLVMWEDLKQGYIWGEDRYDSQFARPNLLDIIPVDENGNLRSPQLLVANFSSIATNASWAVGDIGPAENAWRRSSYYPFALQQALSVMKPGFYFGTLLNADSYFIDKKLDQYTITSSNQRITPTTVKINGRLSDGTIERTVGYINWICDYLTNLGIDPATKIKDYLAGLQVQLGYKVAGFTDKDFLRILAEQSSPTSTNESIIIPNDNYEIFLNKSTPLQKINYSGVIVESSANGWTITGYDNENPFFLIIPSIVNNNFSTIESGTVRGIIYQDFQDYIVRVPYGYEFNTRQQVIEFLISYGRYLEGQGMLFEDFNADLNTQQDWTLSAKEFLIWSQQGWRSGSVIVLSPISNTINVYSTDGTIDFVENSSTGSKILDQNFNLIKNTDFTVVRDGPNFKLVAYNGQMIGFAQLNIVQFEHALIFDNTTLFNDIVYKPELGNRQFRLRLIGTKTGSWNGQLDIPGFIYNNNVIDEWQAGVDYQKGSLVSYKNNYYTALQRINATTQFVSTNWQLLNKEEIKTGLLTNFSYNAKVFENIYDVDEQPNKKSFAKFSKGIIGFRERNYLTDLGLNEETQTKFYQGFIKQKGTRNAVDAFSSVKLTNLESDISTFEEWGIRVGEYGSTDSNDYLEIVLNEQIFGSSPSTFVLLNPSESAPDKIIGVHPDDLYRRPNNYKTNILTNENEPRADIALPVTAGYVNLADIDNTIFDITTYSNLNPILSTIGTGYSIWVAKDYTGDWNVFRVSETNNVVLSIAYNIGNQAVITTYYDHKLEFGDVIAIKNFDTILDGFYQVFNISDNKTFYVTISDTNVILLQKEKVITGSGVLFKLTSSRASSAYDSIVDNAPINNWKSGDYVWADNEFGPGEWAVYKKDTVWNEEDYLPQFPGDYNSGSRYGSAIRLNKTGTLAAAGAPYDSQGKVNIFRRNTENQTFIQLSDLQTPVTPNVSLNMRFGSSIDIGLQKIIVGAPGADNNKGAVFIYDQDYTSQDVTSLVITAPSPTTGDKFGTSLSISDDDRWIYVGAPGANADDGEVHVYQYQKENLIEIPIGNLVVNRRYTIQEAGTTDFSLFGAPSNNPGTTFIATGTGIVSPGEFTIGAYYTITTAGTTDFVLLGAADSIVGTVFQANATGNVAATEFISGLSYTITNVGETNFCNIGGVASSNFTGNIVGEILNVFTITSGTVKEGAVISGTGITAGTYIKGQITGSPGSSGQYYVSTLHSLVPNTSIVAQPTVGTTFTANSSTVLNAGGYAVQGSGKAVQGTGIVLGTNAYKFTITKTAYPVTDLVYTLNFTPANGDSIIVQGLARRYIHLIDYTVSGATLTFVSDPGFDEAGNNFFDTITVTESGYYKYVDTIQPDSGEEGFFGTVVKTTTDGEQVAIGAPQTSNGTGVFVLYDRFKESFIADGYANTFTPNRVVPLDAKVTVNGDTKTLDIDYIIEDNSVRFYSIPVKSSVVTVDINSFDKLLSTSANSSLGNNFGAALDICKNNCSIYVGAPLYRTNDYYYGRVLRFINQGRIYGEILGTVTNPSINVGDSFRINGLEVIASGTTLNSLISDINNTSIPGVIASNSNNKLKITSSSTVQFNRLNILPGSGTILDDLGLEIYVLIQEIRHPNQTSTEKFGETLEVSDNPNTLFVGSRGASTKQLASYDMGLLTLDQDTTRIVDVGSKSGTVYIFDYIGRPDDSVASSGEFTLSQHLSPRPFATKINFGASIASKNGVALVGAPNDSKVLSEAGEVYVYNNPNNRTSWQIIRRRDVKVNLNKMSRLFVYNRKTNEVQTNLDLYDPAKGKVLGVVAHELDYISSYDPAQYNSNNPQIDTIYPTEASDPRTAYKFVYVGTVTAWGSEQVGQLWWNLDSVRYIDYEQDSLVYRSRNWGSMFPGSTIEICEWVESDLPPSAYVGPGTVKFIDGTQYSISYYVDNIGVVRTKYYFWVVNKNVADPLLAQKTKSAYEIANIIQYPQTSGIAYAAAIREDAFNLYGINRYLSGTDAILQLSYSLIDNQNIIHSEYELIKENSSIDKIPSKIINKLADSLTGFTSDGYLVPDPRLPENQKYGIGTRPRQTMFKNRVTALQNFVQYVNYIFAQYPIVLEFSNNKFYTNEAYPLPETGAWDIKVDAYEELDYLDKNLLPVGYRILVTEDTRHDRLWTINELDANNQFNIIRIQTYRTDRYISTTDWYDSNFDPSQQVNYIVNTLNDIEKLAIVPGDTIRVNNEGSGRFAYYIINEDLSLNLVGLEKGTLQLLNSLYDTRFNFNAFDNAEFDSDRYDDTPVSEIRNIFEAVYEDIFIKNLSGEFSNLFFNLVNYILTEQVSVDWIFKTSFISVFHQIRKLAQFPNYIRDNQTYYEDYINEVKPYRTQIREYVLNYTGADTFGGNVTDFDLSSYYNKNNQSFYSPTVADLNNPDFIATLPSGLAQDYTYWLNNHSYQVANITIVDPGVNYINPPTITIVGGGGTGARANASINYSTKTISSITITNPGSNYTSTPTVLINGNGSRTTGANIQLAVNINGTITHANIINPGFGFTKTPSIVITGTGLGANIVCNIDIASGTISNVTINSGGSGYGQGNSSVIATVVESDTSASAYVNLRNVYFRANPSTSYNTVRNIFSKIKFDRVSYTSNVKQWSSNVTYYPGDIVSYQGDAWLANAIIPPTATLALSGNINLNANTVIGILNSTGRANVSANVISANIVFLSNTVGTLQAGTTSWLYELNPTTYTFTTNLGVKVYRITNIFDVTKYIPLQPTDFDNANDRTLGYYTPGPGMIGKDLAQLYTGLEYPGVKVTGPLYNSNVTVNTDVLEFFSSNSTIHTTDITSFSFTRIDMPAGANIKIVGSGNNDGYWTVGTVNDDKITVTSEQNLLLSNENAGNIIALSYFNVDNPSYLDSTIRSDYTDTELGTRPEDINVDGGAYVDRFSSHAPEEFIPGRVYDNLNMQVYTTANVGNVVANLGYRISHGMNANIFSVDDRYIPQYHRISQTNVTILTSNLSVTDTFINVLDASVLGFPGAQTAHPGIIYINKEKIYYYRNLISEVVPWQANVVYTGNVIVRYLGNTYVAANANVTLSGASFNFGNAAVFNANKLTQIRRGVDGTGIPMLHMANSEIVDASLDHKLPGNAHLLSWLNMSGNLADGTGLEGSTTSQAFFIKEEIPPPIYPPLEDEIKQPPLKP